ncbi:MAG TPA: translation initiation factor IF-3 [Chthoniobacteraceae bacterium]|nr:translation initiation factor IF-3 [Chthoniobacteraceae bacterium]
MTRPRKPADTNGGTNRQYNRSQPDTPAGAVQRAQFIQSQQIRVDGRIRAREVRVILGATNEQLGVMKLPDALRKAQSLGLNLVEVAPNAVPPVCRIVDFGKYRYELSKQDKEKKSAAGKLKEIKFRVNIDDHDYQTKVRRSEEFLDKGYKLKIHLQFRGREMAHQELGMGLMQRIKADLNTMAHVEMEPKLVGKSIGMTLSPLPIAKRKRRFQPMEDHELEAEDEDTDDDE